MRKLTNTLVALGAMIFACAQVNAQIVCPANGPAPDNQAITTTVVIGNEQAVMGVPGACTYDITVTIETTSGNPATQNITVDITATSTAPPASFMNSVTLFNGTSSRTVIVTTPSIPCGLVFDYTINVVGGTGCIGNSLFPVELTKFEATTKVNNQIRLTWETASELENQGFEVERSREGKKWETLDFVKGAGTTSEIQSYEWLDVKPYPNESNYYRLKQIDYDGTMEYSSIVVVQMKSDKENIFISPNPASDFLNIQLSEIEKEARIDIWNASGQIVKSIRSQMSDSFVELDISDLPNSIYWVIVSSGNSRQKHKFVKQ